MTGTEIVSFTQKVLLAGDIVAQGDTDIQLMLINRGIKDISRQAPYLDWEDITFAADTATASLPSRFVNLESLGSDTISNLQFKHPSKIKDLTESGTPSSYYFKGLSLIGIHPVPTAETVLRLTYRKGYTLLTALDESPDIPEDFHEALCFYLAMQNYDYFGNNLLTQQKYQQFSSEYFRIVGDLKQWIDSNYYEYESTVDVLPKSSRWIGDD